MSHYKEEIQRLNEQIAGREDEAAPPPRQVTPREHRAPDGDFPPDDSDPDSSESDSGGGGRPPRPPPPPPRGPPPPREPLPPGGPPFSRPQTADTHGSGLSGLSGHRFKDPEKFDGETLKYYEWVSNMDTKFDADWQDATEEAKLKYLLTRTKNEAHDFIEARIPSKRFVVLDPFLSVDECFSEMEKYFGEHDRSSKAFDKFATLKQTPNQSFTEFWAEFRKLRARMKMDPDAEMQHLRYKLNNRYKGKIAGLRFGPGATGLAELIRLLQDTQSDFQSMDATREPGRSNADGQTNKGGNNKGKKTEKTDKSGDAKKSENAAGSGSGDTKPKPRGGSRFQALSKDELQRRRENGQCFTPDCGSKEHMTADCPVRNKKASNNAINLKDQDGAGADGRAPSASDGFDQEKE